MRLLRTIWLTGFCCCLATGVMARQAQKKTSASDGDYVFTKVESEAGTNPQAWSSYMRKSTVLPDSVAGTIPPGTYSVLISFMIDVHGQLHEIKAEKDPGYGLAARALKIFKGYKGEWQPANQCGRYVKSYQKMPVTFVVPKREGK